MTGGLLFASFAIQINLSFNYRSLNDDIYGFFAVSSPFDTRLPGHERIFILRTPVLFSLNGVKKKKKKTRSRIRPRFDWQIFDLL